jgi:hypothetical protein
MKEGVLSMSRTDKDKPYHIVVNEAKKRREDGSHDHTKFGRTRKMRRNVKNEKGETVMETKTVIHIYFSYSTYDRKHGEGANKLLAHVAPSIEPSQHNKKAWIQSTSQSKEIGKLLEDRHTYWGYRYIHGYSYYDAYNVILERETVTVPVEEIVEEPYYLYDECTIDVVPSAENKWGYDLPCSYSPDVSRTGWNGAYQRNRKHREARRNRHTAKAQAYAAKNNANINGYYDEEADDWGDMYVVDYVLRKRWDWD